MDFEAIKSSYPALLRKHWLPLALLLFGVIFFIYGLISLFGASKPEEISFTREDSASQNAAQIAIDIEGAVIKPGVYKLPQGSIIQDILVASGGLSLDADRDFVAKNINLAGKLTDGAKIYIPKLDETTNQSTPQVLGVGGGGGEININTASAESLDTLPGIGPVTANKIIDNRPYLTINDLLDKKLVSEKVFTQIKDKITAY